MRRGSSPPCSRRSSTLRRGRSRPGLRRGAGSAEPMRATRAVVQGRVQGVGCRWFVRQEARRLGVAGWVRNLDDGSVELTVAGEESAVRRLIDHVRVGPDSATVTSLHSESVQAQAALPYPFTVLK